jgi:hypothetical protein
MREILRASNSDLLAEVDRLFVALKNKSVVPELATYRHYIIGACMCVREQLLSNLHDLDVDDEDILPDILSDTQRLARELGLYNQQLAGPILRGLESDRLSLRIINWLHAVHDKTKRIPAAMSNEEFGIWPSNSLPAIYFMPASAQAGLRYQPLFYHEYGHLLYACCQPEMDMLVRELQIQIAEILEPLTHRNDVYGQIEAIRRASIVLVWYSWSQEIFCDAVGLTIGGPAFLHAFNHYLRMGHRSNYYCSADELRHNTHPVTWLRIHLLAHRARSLGYAPLADTIEREWATIAGALKISEDYFGFYENEFLPIVIQTVDDMLTEAASYHFSPHESGDREWSSDSTPIHLVNRAWYQFKTDPDSYNQWERQTITAFLASGDTLYSLMVDAV